MHGLTGDLVVPENQSLQASVQSLLKQPLTQVTGPNILEQ